MRERDIAYSDGEYEVVVDRNSLVLCNRRGTYEHHAHFAKKRKPGGYDVRNIQMVIDYERRKKMPPSQSGSLEPWQGSHWMIDIVKRLGRS